MMDRIIAGGALALLVAAPGTAAAADAYSLDPVHSQPMFEVKHMGFSIQRGAFGRVTGKVTLDRVARKGTIDVMIDTTSIKTFDPRLDAVVKGEDFFNVAKYPNMAFKSSNVIFDGDRVIGADGELTMLGLTRPVVLKVANFVCGEHPMNRKAMCGAEVTATIKRSEWGMSYETPTLVGDEVRITIPVEAYKE
jgi:polyisoprenoid-binding protein YceI